MKKLLLIASLGGALASAAFAQTTPPQSDTAADMQKMMDIRNWQAGPSSGDAASKADTKAQGATDQKRAADLQSLTDIRGWQAGPSSGDTAAKASAAPQAGTPAVKMGAAGTQKELSGESTP